jgi:putative ABC transport system permease protein
MTTSDILKESWLSISGNKVRSFLTILGVIIGVMAVVVMMSVGDAVQNQITGQFSALGTNTIMVRAGASQRGGVRTMSGMNSLTVQDADALGQLLDVEFVSPTRNGSATLIYGNKNWSSSMVGAYPAYADIQNIEMGKGTFFDRSAVRNAATYAVLGPTTAKELGMPDDPVGEVVRVNGVPLLVVGITKEKGESAMGGGDDMLYVPITTMQKRITSSRFPDSVQSIVLKIYPAADNNLAVEQITALLRDRHKLKDDAGDDFQITDMKQVMETMNTVTGFLKLLLMAIASVSLLVGSIGIMNMMLVSVAERTREIGIRKAIGARSSHIITQFLAESVMISFLGSMLGFLLGLILSQFVLPGIMNMAVPLNMWSAVLAIGVAGVVGIAAGVTPAMKAAKLNPIDSLRHE